MDKALAYVPVWVVLMHLLLYLQGSVLTSRRGRVEIGLRLLLTAVGSGLLAYAAFRVLVSVLDPILMVAVFVYGTAVVLFADAPLFIICLVKWAMALVAGGTPSAEPPEPPQPPAQDPAPTPNSEGE
jgi:hypothetical protein